MTVQRTADSPVSGTLIGGQWLAVNERFVHVRFSGFDCAIDRYAATRENPYQVADAHLFERHLLFFAVLYDTCDVGFQVKKFLYCLGASCFHDQRQPLGENVISEHHHCHGEKRYGGIVRWTKYQPDCAADKTRKCSELNKHVLVENATPQRHHRHMHNMVPNSEDQGQGKHSGDPRGSTSEHASQLEGVDAGPECGEKRRAGDSRTHAVPSQDDEGERHEAHDRKHAERKPHAADGITNQPHSGNARSERDQKTPALAHQRALFFIIGTELAWVGDRVADILECLQQVFSACHTRVVLDKRLFMRQTDCNFVNPGSSA